MITDKKHIEFKISAPDAQQVFLAGSFNEWSASADPMRKDQSGVWKKAKRLSPGSYQYKFIVDGVWTLDPDCTATLPNQHGTANNVVAVGGPDAPAAKKEAYVAKIRAELDKWSVEIDRLEAAAEQIKDASKAKYRKQIEALRSMRREFEPKLEDLARSGGKAWEELKDGVEGAWKALRKSIQSATSKFK